MAGLFDGEGCVSVIKRSSKGYVYHQVDVRICMTSLAVLEAVQRTYGGNITAMKKQAAHHKQNWHWYCQGDVAFAVLMRIRPFSIEKRPQIELACRFHRAHQLGLRFDRERVKQQLQWLKVDTTRRLVSKSTVATQNKNQLKVA